MTADFIGRHFPRGDAADRVIVPGRCRGESGRARPGARLRIERGPDELRDLPEHFGRQRKGVDLSMHDVQIFAEIVDCPAPEPGADRGARAGLPTRRGRRDRSGLSAGNALSATWPSRARAARGRLARSVDSLEREDLLIAGRAGADYLLS